MHKPAEHRIDTCPTCQGEGTVKGPKVVYLAKEEYDEYQKWRRLDRFNMRVFAVSFYFFLVTSGLLLIPILIALSLLLPNSRDMQAGCGAGIVMGTCTITMLCWHKARSGRDRMVSALNNILNKYGTSLEEEPVIFGEGGEDE